MCLVTQQMERAMCLFEWKHLSAVGHAGQLECALAASKETIRELEERLSKSVDQQTKLSRRLEQIDVDNSRIKEQFEKLIDGAAPNSQRLKKPRILKTFRKRINQIRYFSSHFFANLHDA